MEINKYLAAYVVVDLFEKKGKVRSLKRELKATQSALDETMDDYNAAARRVTELDRNLQRNKPARRNLFDEKTGYPTSHTISPDLRGSELLDEVFKVVGQPRHRADV